MSLTRRLVLGGGAVTALGAGTLGLGWWRVDGPGAARPSSATDPALPLPLGDMTVTLTDHQGRRVAAADWVGRPTVAFFGFTWCPEVCPTTLSDISVWLEELGAEADSLNVAFITADPERDTPKALAEYLTPFDPRIVGYTGTPEEIAETAAAFRVRIEKRPVNQGDYTVDHTAGVFLFRADGSFGTIIDYHEDRTFAVPKIRRILNQA
ncbi:SCO family protein [Rubellimicrobium aerolatum]|uniref:SCO family protein n=1 Tax=Rubellimicrobium aerolatum TaxID=490979 RepID=A0ABW0SE12_9RHOB|nr:protein SCO1/2 [Rubellimicrobium aerolatum]